MTILTLGLISLAILAGCLWLAHRPPDNGTAGRLQTAMAVGTGFTVAMLVLELIPETRELALVHGHSPWLTLAGTALLVWALDRWAGPFLTERLSDHDDHGHGHCCHPSSLGRHTACSAVGCLLICLFADGAALKASQTAGTALSGMVAVSLVLHLLPEALFCVTMMQAAGVRPVTVKRTAWMASLAFSLGSLLPLQAIPAQYLLVPAVAGILLMVSGLHLLPAVNVSRAARWMMVAGGGSYWLVERLVSSQIG